MNDFAILFGPTCCGKSLLAVMIAEEAYKVFIEMGLRDFSILYFDMEMREYQYQMRYEDPKTEKSHDFPKALIRVECCYSDIYTLTEDNMLEHFEDAIRENNARLLIIDDFTCLCKGKKASTAAVFLQKLRLLRNRRGLSILLVAHSQKRNDFKPITIADLNGSGYMSAAVDSIFAMNFSRKGNDIRYVKQLKSRDSHIEYGADNVLQY
ncbi:MAG: AAA family ATPase, partial [Prevotella sp.]|nr:AAA family ATPase [Prevotella sp.]